MKVVLTTEKVPIKMWSTDIERGALHQARKLANLPFAFHHIALMPDCHQGYGGMPIGGVLAAKDVVVPNAVGENIGCGVCTNRTNLAGSDLNRNIINKTMSCIRKRIPMNFKCRTKHDLELKSFSREIDELNYGVSGLKVVEQEYKNAIHQLGTLGSDDHFIEIQKSDCDTIWLMLHSGSRNLGYTVANYYNQLANKLNEKWYSSVPYSAQSAFLPLDSDEGRAYISEMNYCINFAKLNRRIIMSIVEDCLMENSPEPVIVFSDPIDVPHNYASIEKHFGEKVVVHRKGTIQASDGQICVVPGSQGSSSYIGTGKGNKESFMSCSHSARRKLSRKQTIRKLDSEQEVEALNKKGIHSIRNKVIQDESDLISIKLKLEPLGVVKG